MGRHYYSVNNKRERQRKMPRFNTYRGSYVPNIKQTKCAMIFGATYEIEQMGIF